MAHVQHIHKAQVVPKFSTPGVRVETEERKLQGGFRNEHKEDLGTRDREQQADMLATVVEYGDANKETHDEKAREQAKAKNALLVDELWFNVFVTTTVVLNAFLIGLEQEFSESDTGIADRFLWYMIELLFAVVFLGEMIARFCSLQISFILDFWNLADTLIVVGAVIDAIVLQPANAGGKLRLLTTLRILRCVRLVRLVRMFPVFRELWLLVGGLVNSVKALAWVCLILFLVMYSCGVVVTTLIGQNDEVYGNGPSYDGEVWPYKEYFGSVFKSMFTLFQVMTLDGWVDDVVRHIIFFQPLLAILFMMFVVLSAFGLMNVVIGVIVENTLAAASVADQAVDKEKAARRRKALDQLQVLLELSDSSRSGEISLREIQAAAQSRIVQLQFEALEVRQTEVETLFELLDYERKGKVELKRFITSCRELVGGVRRRDIAQVEITVGTLTQRLDSLDKKFSHIEEEVACMGNLAEDFLQHTVRALTGFDGRNIRPT
mmetsp:Transcript_67782/g.107439  ORF Transcript_67782/g.107439 Transcript_67782/m.107439 type:complete len:492 (-) Transcript_67782:24-1499(-)|eukprot:CAMPEP_0169103678 /NCGR_PEP_ID=MMETSP1015-20121227/22846_1 /TAXON_ID=342587 /ORGANISM="Karlodinium micrum, Strain CCMP2283" /LENGTH=491 /DNA_ID=CAMNT_0009164897 /DNA_START=131 /DNA_END=1606 /DNA_ORIENTATION=+